MNTIKECWLGVLLVSLILGSIIGGAYWIAANTPFGGLLPLSLIFLFFWGLEEDGKH